MLNDYEKEKTALRELRARALGNEPEVPASLAPDIDAHFAKPTPSKSFQDLLALYEQKDDEKARDYVLRACGKKQEAKDLFRKEAEILAKWFLKHPSEDSVNHFRKLVGKDYAKESALTLLVADMGDGNVVKWAEQFVKRRKEDDWIGYYGFARETS